MYGTPCWHILRYIISRSGRQSQSEERLGQVPILQRHTGAGNDTFAMRLQDYEDSTARARSLRIDVNQRIQQPHNPTPFHSSLLPNTAKHQAPTRPLLQHRTIPRRTQCVCKVRTPPSPALGSQPASSAPRKVTIRSKGHTSPHPFRKTADG